MAAQRIGEIIAGRRAVTADTDPRPCRSLGPSNGNWLRAQVAVIELFNVHFYAPDVEGLRAWYAKHFGAATPTAANPNAMGVPGMSLSFRKTDAAQAATKGRSLDHIGFEVKDLDAFCKKLVADGVTFEVPCRDVPSIGLKIAFLVDPSGTRVELTEGLAKR